MLPYPFCCSSSFLSACPSFFPFFRKRFLIPLQKFILRPYVPRNKVQQYLQWNVRSLARRYPFFFVFGIVNQVLQQIDVNINICANALLAQNQKLNQAAAGLRTVATIWTMKQNANQAEAAIAEIKQTSMPAGIQLFTVQKGKMEQDLSDVEAELNAIVSALNNGQMEKAKEHVGEKFQLSIQFAENNIVCTYQCYSRRILRGLNRIINANDNTDHYI